MFRTERTHRDAANWRPGLVGRYGFTLVEMMVVVVVILILAGLLLPAVNYAQARAQTRKCMNTARQIAAAVQTYAASNGGWTPPYDADHYVGLMGLRLDTDCGYLAAEPWYRPRVQVGWAADTTSQSYGYAQTIRTLACPSDVSPSPTRHAVRSSYQMALVSENLMGLEKPSRTLLVRELVSRHADGDLRLANYVFADLHAQFGVKEDEYVQGLYARWWNTTGTTSWSRVRSDTMTTDPDYTSIWVHPLSEARFDYLPLIGLWRDIPSEPLDSPLTPDNLMMRMDGYIEFPRPGRWLFISYSYNDAYAWVDVNENGTVDTGESGTGQASGTYRRFMDLPNLEAGKKYPFVFAFRENTGTQRLYLYWTQDTVAATNMGRCRKSVVPVSALYFRPYTLQTAQ